MTYKSKERDYVSAYYKRWVKKKLEENPNWFSERHTKVKDYSKEYKKKNKSYFQAKEKIYRKKFPLKVKARRLSKDILLDKCKFCGSLESLERHHPNYNEPLNVVILCKTCHQNFHKAIRRLMIQ